MSKAWETVRQIQTSVFKNLIYNILDNYVINKNWVHA